MNPVRTTVSLRVRGDELEPKEISRLLGRFPDRGVRKGESFIGKNGRPIASRTGVWSVNANVEISGLEDQIMSVLASLSSSPDVWKAISDRYQVDLFCGVWLDPDALNAMGFSADVLKNIADRNIDLDLHFYDAELSWKCD